MVKSQREELKRYLKQDDFLKFYEKYPCYKAALNFKTKMHTQSKTQ